MRSYKKYLNLGRPERPDYLTEYTLQLGGHIKYLLNDWVCFWRHLRKISNTSLNKYELMYVYDFFGEDHVLFHTDFPYDVEQGGIKLREGIKAIDSMDIPESSKKKIYEGYARKLLHFLKTKD
jgi:predicted TIM-barrel fold metal-dependent hydrolase